jgi:hypothetical protein
MNVILDAEMVAFSNRLNKVDGAYTGLFHAASGLNRPCSQNSGEYEA